MRAALLFALAFLFACGGTAAAQQGTDALPPDSTAADSLAGLFPRPPGVAPLSDSARASLLTMLPGRAVYALFGHSAIRIADPATGLDKTYNYGTFDFNQPFFIVRFLRGKLDYILDTAPFERELMQYQYQGRPIIEQRLTLTPAAVHALYALLETNALPENRAYRYDFFFDNCSTRLLGAFEAAQMQATGERIEMARGPSGQTFRDWLAPYLVGAPAIRTGLNLALGLPGDREATRREATFLPLELADQLDGAWAGGRPLVAQRDTLFTVEGMGLPEPAFDWMQLVGWLLFALGTGATLWSRFGQPSVRWRTAGRRADGLLFVAVGLVGSALAFLWLGTEHVVMGPTIHPFWAWPTHLGAAFFLGRTRPGRAFRLYFAAAGLAALVTLGASVGLPQPMPAAALPLVLLVALRALDRAVGER